MHDFCFTIPYGFAVLTGGVLGYLRRDSTASLAGALLILAGFVSLKAFEKRRKSYLAFALEIHGVVASNTLDLLRLVAFGEINLVASKAGLMCSPRYLETSKIMPARIVAGLSALMSAFYLFKIATGGNHIPQKKE